MSLLKNRVSKLEATINPEAAIIHIQRFIIDCSGFEPIGYRCDKNGSEIMRLPEESEESLHKRCGELVVWPPGTGRHVFAPIYEPGQILPSMV